MGDDRPIAYQEGKTSVYRASSIGACKTQLVASKLGYQTDRYDRASEILDSAAKEGTAQEDIIIEALKRDLGWRVWGGQDVMEERVIPRVIIRGHIDGICIPKGMRNERLLEVKTMSQDRFKIWQASGSNVKARLLSPEFEKYAWQISAYMHAHDNMPVMYVVKNRNTGVMDIDELKLPPVDWKQIRTKLVDVEKLWKREEIPDCDAASGDKFFCLYPYLHDQSVFGDEPDDEEPVVESATEALIAGMAEHYVELANKVKQLKPWDDERKAIGKRIVEAMPVKKMEAGEYTITRVDSSNKVVDHEAAARAIVDVMVENYNEESGFSFDAETLRHILDDTKADASYSYARVKRNTK